MADLYWEAVKEVRDADNRPLLQQIVRQYLKSDLSRMDEGDDVVIADFRAMTGYVLNLTDKMFMKMNMADVGKIPDSLSDPMKATPTTETQDINGYSCVKYRVYHMGAEYEMWLSKDVDGYSELRSFAERIGPKMRANPLFHMGIVGRMDVLDGFPVKAVIPMSGGKTKTIILKSVSLKSLDDSVFQVPRNFGPPY